MLYRLPEPQGGILGLCLDPLRPRNLPFGASKTIFKRRRCPYKLSWASCPFLLSLPSALILLGIVPNSGFEFLFLFFGLFQCFQSMLLLAPKKRNPQSLRSSAGNRSQLQLPTLSGRTQYGKQSQKRTENGKDGKDGNSGEFRRTKNGISK